MCVCVCPSVLSQRPKKKVKTVVSQQALMLEHLSTNWKAQMMTVLFLNVLKSRSDMSGISESYYNMIVGFN